MTITFHSVSREYINKQMNLKQKLRLKHKQKLETAFIFSLLICIAFFYFMPVKIQERTIPEEYTAPVIKIINIPRTVQITLKRPPKPSLPVIPVAAEEDEILEEVKVNLKVDPSLQGIDDGIPDVITKLPYIPRQVVEVFPKKCEAVVFGTIVLALRIGKDGKVKDYKVKENTTKSDACLQSVIKAAKKSQWEPILLKNTRVEYWIDKKYVFE